MARGDLDAAMRVVMDEVRAKPSGLAPRLALFQLAALVGDWPRAGKQLQAVAEIDVEAAPMAQTYVAAIEAEAARRAVFAGTERAVCLGEPPAWVAMLSEALALDARGAGTARSNCGSGRSRRRRRWRARWTARPSPGSWTPTSAWGRSWS